MPQIQIAVYLRYREKEPLQKHAFSNILKVLQPQKENFQIKNYDIFHISAQNIDCEYSFGGSNEYPQSMFFEQKYEK